MDRGKPFKVAVNVCMDRLLRILVGAELFENSCKNE